MRFELKIQGVQTRFDQSLFHPFQFELTGQEAIVKLECLQDADKGAIREPAAEEVIYREFCASKRVPPNRRDWVLKQAGKIDVDDAEGDAQQQLDG